MSALWPLCSNWYDDDDRVHSQTCARAVHMSTAYTCFCRVGVYYKSISDVYGRRNFSHVFTTVCACVRITILHVSVMRGLTPLLQTSPCYSRQRFLYYSIQWRQKYDHYSQCRIRCVRHSPGQSSCSPVWKLFGAASLRLISTNDLSTDLYSEPNVATVFVSIGGSIIYLPLLSFLIDNECKATNPSSDIWTAH